MSGTNHTVQSWIQILLFMCSVYTIKNKKLSNAKHFHFPTLTVKAFAHQVGDFRKIQIKTYKDMMCLNKRHIIFQSH